MPKCGDCRHPHAAHNVPVRGGTSLGCDRTDCGCVHYAPARSSVLRSPVARRQPTVIVRERMCVCGHKSLSHRIGDATNCKRCSCAAYAPLRAARKSAPARTKRRLMPKCKHCAYPFGRHDATALGSCPGYEPSRGIRQKRRTPAAALKLRCDNLWTAIVHHRPEACEVQRFYAHGCEGGPQALHGIPRTFNVTRHLPINGFKGCAGIHLFMTKRPELWSSVLLDAWGEPTFRELWSKARAMQPVDMSATYASLKAEAALREIE